MDLLTFFYCRGEADRSCRSFFAPKQGRVINATGVVVHTNLGRAPLSDPAKEAIIEAASYSSVEMDVDEGKRGRRGGFAEDLVCELTGAEAAVIVNNCAAARLPDLVRSGERKRGDSFAGRTSRNRGRFSCARCA